MRTKSRGPPDPSRRRSRAGAYGTQGACVGTAPDPGGFRGRRVGTATSREGSMRCLVVARRRHRSTHGARHPVRVRIYAGRSLETSNDPVPRGRRRPSSEPWRSGAPLSSMNAGGARDSPILPDSGWSAPCARGSSPAQASPGRPPVRRQALHPLCRSPRRHPGPRQTLEPSPRGWTRPAPNTGSSKRMR